MLARPAARLGRGREHRFGAGAVAGGPMRKAGLPPWRVDGVAELHEHFYAAGAAAHVVETVERVIGRRATTWRSFLTDHADALRAPASVP